MNLSKKLAIYLICCLVSLSVSEAATIKIIEDKREYFEGTLTSIGDISTDRSYSRLFGNNWVANVKVTETDDTNDDLIIEGVFHHVKPPHNEGPSFPLFDFSFDLDIDSLLNSGGTITMHDLSTADTKGHDLHEDLYIAILDYTVLDHNLSTDDDIIFYELKLIGRHQKKNFIPAPNASILTLIGLCAFFKNRKNAKNYITRCSSFQP